ncbi:MAG TPA: hypothetical protein VLS89_14300, partial [Candidatus Nanopelagicales bacterium]|nr:hypothetical protein [Candidatus Nanopelagicales bacterium]
LTVLRPKRTRKKTPTEVIDAAEMRDRLWTLLTQRHALLWRAGAYLFGKDEVDARVPPLQSRVAAPKKRKGGEVEAQGG